MLVVRKLHQDTEVSVNQLPVLIGLQVFEPLE